MEAARIGGHALPDGAERYDFAASWPVAEERLARVLRARGAQRADVDDIGQEVAYRALVDPDRFESEEHLVRWSCRVAINLYIDSGRRQLHLSGSPLPDGTARDDTSSTAERRMALAALMTQVHELSDADRQLLFDPATTDSRREAVRLAVRRHRLRARLAVLTEGLLGVFGGLGTLWRMARGQSGPVKVALVAVPVVAVLALVPFVSMLRPTTGEVAGSHYQRAVADDNRGARIPSAESPARRQGVGRDGRAQPTRAAAVPSRTLVAINAAGMPVSVRELKQPDSRPTICGHGYVNFCIDRPGPVIQVPAWLPAPVAGPLRP